MVSMINSWDYLSTAEHVSMLNIFGSIVYIRTKVYIHQNFLKLFHVITSRQWNQTACLYEVQVTVYSILVAVVQS